MVGRHMRRFRKLQSGGETYEKVRKLQSGGETYEKKIV